MSGGGLPAGSGPGGNEIFRDRVAGSAVRRGGAFSTADITVFAGLMFANAAGIAVSGDCSKLRALRTKVSALPSAKDRSGRMFVSEDLRRLGF
ncbi:hypothetical protein [Xanthobacter sp. VNH20]|uniref:hypothetical protein n=1 Tax=Xanthobacter sp. VNH20 TaxID=3156616 RepID=UPI0032B424B5